MRVMNAKIAVLCFSLAVSAYAGAAEITMRERLSPTNKVQSVQGRCGNHDFGINLRYAERLNVLSLTVDGLPVPRDEIDKVTAAVSKGYAIYDPSFVECIWDGPNARMRIVTDGPTSGGKPIWLSFEVSPARSVSGVRRD